ncbi:Crp/Fnr family transcriptional regulator [Candidatus Chlorohelix sp.]|uniref:Crp/Fnr family transcriptional regulator n=1 Tax=Candidatus Chlorohelix sp. TaxID=3139201 RepID=UPI00303F473D
MPNEENFLASIPFFASIAADELKDLVARVKRRVYKHGETIYHKDDAGSTMYVIVDGTVKVSVPSESGAEMILAILCKGDFFGELSLFDGKPRSATVTSVGPADVLTIYRDDFIDFLKKHPMVAVNVIATLSQRIRLTDALVEDVVFLDIPARLAKKLLELSNSYGKQKSDGSIEIELRLTQQDIANMLGTTRESVNRQLVAFQERNYIAIDRQRITLIKPDELAKRIY